MKTGLKNVLVVGPGPSGGEKLRNSHCASSSRIISRDKS